MGWAPWCSAISLHEAVKQGNDLFKQEKYKEALDAYASAQIEHPDDPRLKYNIAACHYKMKDYEKALEGYRDAATMAHDPALQEKALYNAGNALYRLGRLEEAVTYYQKALELDPQDKEAQHNLEFVREEIQRRINEAKKNEQQQDQDNKTCPHPQQQPREGDNQTSRQEADNQTLQQGHDNQTQTLPHNVDNQTAAQNSHGNEQGDHMPKASGQQPPEQSANDQGNPSSDTMHGTVQPRYISPDEAEQILNTIQETRQHLKERKDMVTGKGHVRPAQDW
ncbi:MAG: tetratricopeptide repeat protein [Desulfobacterota bacterium]|nr:tetratricopeptide repeat protein [Thermodesulfobacteriota bacterium]